MSNSLDVLAKNRDALLLAEVGAWLHMFGKLQEDFLKGKTSLAREIPKVVKEHFIPLDALLKGNWVGSIWQTLPLGGAGTERLSIAQLIRTHEENDLTKYSEGFRKLLIDAHGRVSGIEKGVLDRFLLPHNDPVYLSTAVGYETDIKPTNISQSRQHLYDFLQEQMELLKNKGAKLSYEEWSSVQKTFVEKMCQYFSITVAETRRPLNDVTLFDQTAMTVAFFKASLSQNLLTGKWKEPVHGKVDDQYHWRLLRVGLDGMVFWGNAIRISDLLARKELIKDTLNGIQQLLEVKYPLGSEVYRDENGSVFIVPDIADLLTYTDRSQSLEQHIQAIADKKFSDETRLTLLTSERTRDMLSFGKLATKILPRPTPQIVWLQQQWQGRERDICPICGLRPQGPGTKALSRKVCGICEERRSDRSKHWMKNPATTIWIDEVADRDGQLALLVGRFDIVDWLSGSAFNTVFSLDPASQRLPLQEIVFDLQQLNDDIREGLKPDQRFKDNLLGKLVLEKRRGGSEVVQDFYDLHVTNTDLRKFSPVSRPELLSLSLLRQNPSLARIRRTWETIREFWKDVGSNFKTTVGEVSTRINIHGTFLPNGSNSGPPVVSHAYELKLDTVNLSIICVKEGEFLTADNLQRVAILLNAPEESTRDDTTAARYVFDRIQSKYKSNIPFEIVEPAGYGRLYQMSGSLAIRANHLDQRFSYLPAITLVTEPRTFMALVPAEKAWKVLEGIQNKYEREMSKVRNRLPLTVGVVFANSRTPLPAILDAGRRMLQQPTADECWIVNRKLMSSSGEVTLTLKNETHSLSVTVPTMMGDHTTDDAWYPYWCVEKDAAGNTPTGRQRHIQGVDGKEWVHVRNLEVGDVVHFKPSRFDFELLDTAARRFEIGYENGMRRGSYHPARPYYLEELNDFKILWQILSRGLANSQIHDLIEFIETKRTLWDAKKDDATFQRIVRDSLNNAYWHARPAEAELDCLEQAALSGQLTDVFELYVRILKNTTEIDKAGGNT